MVVRRQAGVAVARLVDYEGEILDMQSQGWRGRGPMFFRVRAEPVATRPFGCSIKKAGIGTVMSAFSALAILPPEVLWLAARENSSPDFEFVDSPLEEAGFKLSVPRPNAELSDTLLERRQVRAKGQAEFGPAFSLFHPE
jgi:hypothetical protein